MDTTPNASPAADPLALRRGYLIAPAALDFVARTAADALTAEGGRELEARRSLAEVARIVGEVLRRARVRAQGFEVARASRTEADAP